MTANTNEQARFNMIEQQIRPWEVMDPQVLQLMGSMPRDAFVPDAYQGLAYADIEIPLGNGQSMLSPKIEGRLLQALNIQSGDRVLEIGTGSGYLTACMAKLAGKVLSLDTENEFITHAQARLDGQGITNIELRCADGLAEDIEDGAFDAIAVTGSVPVIPEKLKRMLTVGGRLFAVTGEALPMEAVLVTRTDAESWHSKSLFETELKPLNGVPTVEHFSF
ncbi:MAG: protein-L-isoaspartate O-methyltransferase [Candidatus Sedimenticola sp. (ex Thyasira tokunagai)]